MANRPPLDRKRAFAFLSALAALSLLQCSAERIVHRQASLSGELIVSETPGPVRTLRFGENGAVQSQVFVGKPKELLVPYTATAIAALGAAERPQRILVVGLGGGSIPNFLHEVLPAAVIDVAEIDPAVVEVAQSWFEVKPDERLRLHVADGRRFIERVTVPYDAIFLDAYGATDVPPSLTTREFLTGVRDALAPGGVTIGNLWSDASDGLYPSMVATYRDVFPEVHVIPVTRRTNRIVLALSNPSIGNVTDRLDAFAKSHALQDALRAGIEQPLSRGEILYDP